MRARIAFLGTLLAGWIASATPSGAAPVIFDIDGGSSPLSGDMGNVRTFTGNDGETELQVRAFSRISAAVQLADAYLGYYGGGLGITNSGEGTGGSNSHTMDNRGRLEFMLFAFESAIIPTSITLTPYSDPKNNNLKDSDFSAWVGTVANYSTATLAGLTLAQLNTNFTRLQDSLQDNTTDPPQPAHRHQLQPQQLQRQRPDHRVPGDEQRQPLRLRQGQGGPGQAGVRARSRRARPVPVGPRGDVRRPPSPLIGPFTLS
jgi:hypothetical protein